MVLWGRGALHAEPKLLGAGGRGSASCCRDASGHHARAALLRAQARGSIFQTQPLDARRGFGAGLLTYQTRAAGWERALLELPPLPERHRAAAPWGRARPGGLAGCPGVHGGGGPGGAPTHGVPQGALPSRMPCAYSGALLDPHAWGGPIHPKGTLGTPNNPPGTSGPALLRIPQRPSPPRLPRGTRACRDTRGTCSAPGDPHP